MNKSESANLPKTPVEGGATPVTGTASPAIDELIAIGAAIAANCEPCLRYHVLEAGKLGIPRDDIKRAIQIATMVKESPHRSILRLAARLTDSPVPEPVAAAGCCRPA